MKLKYMTTFTKLLLPKMRSTTTFQKATIFLQITTIFIARLVFDDFVFIGEFQAS